MGHKPTPNALVPRAQWRLSSTSAESAFVIEMLFRLGVALLLSLSLALLLAWGWDSSDTPTAQPPAAASETPSPPAPLH
jgi:hypothetical protein